MAVYQIDVPDELWTEWKATVSRDRTLNDRIVTPIKTDTSNAN